MKIQAPCSISECTRKNHASGLCRGHYMQLYFHGHIKSVQIQDNNRTGLVHKKKPKKKCIVKECDRNSAGQTGHCGAHYSQIYRNGIVVKDVIVPRKRRST